MENIQSAWRRLWVVFRNDTPTVFLILAFATLRGAFSLVLPLGFQALIGQLMGGRLSASWWVLFFVVLLFSGSWSFLDWYNFVFRSGSSNAFLSAPPIF